MRRIYVASSWRNPIQQEIVRVLREAGHEVYDFRNPAPGNKGFAWSEVNPDWLQWSPEQFVSDLYSGHPAVERGFAFDKAALDWADTCVLVLPCGRSAHLEAGYAAGQGKLTLFYLHPDKFEPELMYLLGQGCVTNPADLLRAIEEGGIHQKSRKVHFEFDDRSLVSVDQLKRQGHELREIEAGDRTILIPTNCGF